MKGIAMGYQSGFDFDRLSQCQQDVFGMIATNWDEGHPRQTLASLVRLGLIEEFEMPIGGHPPCVVKRYRVPWEVHIDWCRWCSRQEPPIKEPAPTCSKCKKKMVRSSERYWACPSGHGKLLPAGHVRDAKAIAEEREVVRKADAALKAASSLKQR